MLSKKYLGFVTLVWGLLTAATSAQTWNWKITKDAWTVGDEKKYSDWIKALGESGCTSIDRCLKSAANIYRSTDPKNAKFFSDCADLPYVLRMYFAWKNALPFAYSAEVTAVGSSDDVRYSPNGNRPARRVTVRNIAGEAYPNARSLLAQAVDDVSSAMYRVAPEYDSDSLPSDLYSVNIQVGAIRPGTVIYDPNGHVAVIYRIEADGRLRFMDAHPDNSLTRGTYGQKFARSRPASGAGFKNFRPLKLVDYQKANGVLVGGKVRALRNSEIPDFSTVQFYGTHPVPGSWSKGRFFLSGTELPYYDYVRAVMSGGNLTFQPLEEVKNMVDALCSDLRDRVMAVNHAVEAKLTEREAPEALPSNIYGTSGDWEEFSTPSRDARLKTSFKEVFDSIANFLKLASEGSSRIEYHGVDLKADLLSTYLQTASQCSVVYTNSHDRKVEVSYEEIVHRLFALSFDPYHCVERRWGATEAGELASCRDDSLKTRWYRAERKLRNQIERTYDAKMNYTLESYESGEGAQLGVETAPEVDPRRLLQ